MKEKVNYEIMDIVGSIVCREISPKICQQLVYKLEVIAYDKIDIKIRFDILNAIKNKDNF